MSEAEAWRLLALLKRAAATHRVEQTYWESLAGRLTKRICQAYVVRRFGGNRT